MGQKGSKKNDLCDPKMVPISAYPTAAHPIFAPSVGGGGGFHAAKKYPYSIYSPPEILTGGLFLRVRNPKKKKSIRKPKKCPKTHHTGACIGEGTV